MSEEKLEIVKADADYALAPANLKQVESQVLAIQNLMKSVMKKDEHYGVIPGCGSKPTLLKPGAEKLNLVFRMAPEYEITESPQPNEHKEFNVICKMYSIGTHVFLGSGVGVCSTMETKWRYRKAEQTCPKCGKPAIVKGKKEYGGGWLCFKKKDGCGAKFPDGDKTIENQDMGRVEHDNPADYYNTCLKMAKKRAQIDATLTVTAASDIFTQDIEDLKANGVIDADFTIKDAESEPETETVSSSKPVSIDDLGEDPEPPATEPKKQGRKSTRDYVNEIKEHCTFINNMFDADRAADELQKASSFEKDGKQNDGFNSLKRLIEVHNNDKLSWGWASAIAHNLRKVAENLVKE